ncbi:phosphate regulon transcriptional regulator PhoB [Thiohalobacter sp.]|uniref:phosphate regulon transcriptional regulator PhoB n=1 Tax=Thiohalobacter sp. TaxID=2025948 RepID=UPI00260E598B|nr:phosphate regulon transcriptional regulator PhoB [Thiohalobacter sp.]
MTAATILIVEDEAAIRDMVRFALERAEFETREAGDAAAAQVAIADQPPDLILLDWMLPDLSGIDLARRLRKDELTRDIPVIMLTARGEEEDKIRGLEVGADDYITKPFSPRELVARIRAVLRRVRGEGGERPIEIEGLILDPVGHRVSAHGEPLEMGPTEFRLLHFFMAHPERVFSRSRLLDSVWGRNVYVEERTVDVHIRRLRKALAPHGHDRLIQTVRGAGYRFSRQV